VDLVSRHARDASDHPYAEALECLDELTQMLLDTARDVEWARQGGCYPWEYPKPGGRHA
jgi:hypothetical protein